MTDQFRNGIGRALDGEQSGADAAYRSIGREPSGGDLDEPLQKFDEGLRTEKTAEAGGWRYARKIRRDAVHEEPWRVLKKGRRDPGDEDGSDEDANKFKNDGRRDLEEADGVLAIVKPPVSGILNEDGKALRQSHEKTRRYSRQKG